MTTATLHDPALASTDEVEILGLIEKLIESNYTKNAALFAKQFAQEAAIFNLAPPLTHVGVDLKEKQAWMDSWATPVGLEARNFKVTVSGDLAFCHGFMRLFGTKWGADRPADFWMRETLCLERQQGAWKIVHEHCSVPFYMDASTRPAFDLKPEA